jgi:hypothetical protein
MNLASKKQSEQYKQVAIWLSWLGVMVMTVLAYWPGLSGPFMLDDYGAIAALGKYDGVRDWETFKAYVFGGHSGPTGRPVSLLTFLIDSQNWPADPWPFKRTNLIIHLLNGVLCALHVGSLWWLRPAGYCIRFLCQQRCTSCSAWHNYQPFSCSRG